MEFKVSWPSFLKILVRNGDDMGMNQFMTPGNKEYSKINLNPPEIVAK